MKDSQRPRPAGNLSPGSDRKRNPSTRAGRTRGVSARGNSRGISKVPTGIAGLDDITGGGLPKGRPTLVCGNAGCGKTLLAAEFLVRGATQFDEPGVFVAFEETAEELADNVMSLGFDLDALVNHKKIIVDAIRVERSEIEETGEYDLEGLFIRLGHAIDTIGARRVALDSIESLFAGLSNTAILRAELRRLFRWLKERGVTAVITGERTGGPTLTRQGLEEFVSDCVILLDHRVTDQLAIRRLRVVKYRGTVHGTNEYPFLIDARGFSVVPITSASLRHEGSLERVSSGVSRLDAMLDGGFYKGSSILLSGTAGTGKTSFAAFFADASCRRGEKCLFFSMEESKDQLLRNMQSIGLDLKRWLDRGLLRFSAARPTSYGLESHLVAMHRAIEEFQPRTVIVDSISSFLTVGSGGDARSMLIRLIDHLKSSPITAFLTSLGPEGGEGDIQVSSIIDTWIVLRDVERDGDRSRALYIAKSRGMAHSNQVREFLLTNKGVDISDAREKPDAESSRSIRKTNEVKRANPRIRRTARL